eukprot:6185468-Pleurochrysis_carterae.AAC.1
MEGKVTIDALPSFPKPHTSYIDLTYKHDSTFGCVCAHKMAWEGLRWPSVATAAAQRADTLNFNSADFYNSKTRHSSFMSR